MIIQFFAIVIGGGLLAVAVTWLLTTFVTNGTRITFQRGCFSKVELTARAQATPLLVGAKGSPLELVLNSLYFESDVPAAMPYAEADRVGRGK